MSIPAPSVCATACRSRGGGHGRGLPGQAPRREGGAVLVIGLIFLVILTLLGMAAMSVGSLEERMSGNAQDRDVAFQAAEASLRDCESVLENVSLPPFNNSKGLYQLDSGATQSAEDPTNSIWDGTCPNNAGNSARVLCSYSDTVVPAGNEPRCIIEEQPGTVGAQGNASVKAGMPVPPVGIYLVTAKGMGKNSNTVVVLQTAFHR